MVGVLCTVQRVTLITAISVLRTRPLLKKVVQSAKMDTITRLMAPNVSVSNLSSPSSSFHYFAVILSIYIVQAVRSCHWCIFYIYSNVCSWFSSLIFIEPSPALQLFWQQQFEIFYWLMFYCFTWLYCCRTFDVWTYCTLNTPMSTFDNVYASYGVEICLTNNLSVTCHVVTITQTCYMRSWILIRLNRLINGYHRLTECNYFVEGIMLSLCTVCPKNCKTCEVHIEDDTKARCTKCNDNYQRVSAKFSGVSVPGDCFCTYIHFPCA